MVFGFSALKNYEPWASATLEEIWVGGTKTKIVLK
jgi:hypothetical protein